MISPEGEKKINKSVAELHEANGSEIYVVTTPHLPAGETEVQLARRLLEDWTRSCSTTDKGMLVLLSMQDRRWGWRTGCDTEKVLSDSKVRAIMERDAIPYFKRGEYELGLMRAADSFASTLINQRDQGAIGERPVGLNLFMGLLGLVFIVAPTAYLMIQNAVHMSPTGHTVSENGPIIAALKAPTATILGGSFIALISGLLSHSSWSYYLVALLCFLLFLTLWLDLVAREDAHFQGFLRLLLKLRPRRIVCRRCKGRMVELPKKNVLALLSGQELKKAGKLKVSTFKAWNCPSCSSIAGTQDDTQASSLDRALPRSACHIYELQQNPKYSYCPKCRNKSVFREDLSVSQAAYCCKVCDYMSVVDQGGGGGGSGVVYTGGFSGGGGGGFSGGGGGGGCG
ncbi:MAG: TPM domain-containing protein, partial [Vulcanococcus sp.]